MVQIAQHKVMVAGDSYTHCCTQVEIFFDHTLLVNYDEITIIKDKSFAAIDAAFTQQLKNAEEKNRQTVGALLTELQETGIKTISELQHLKHGYPSKLLHVLSHLLDGFIGIDSYFYNLLDDSHWVSSDRHQIMSRELEKYWLIHLDCYSEVPENAFLLKA